MLPIFIVVLLVGLVRAQHPCATATVRDFAPCIEHARGKWLQYQRRADSLDACQITAVSAGLVHTTSAVILATRYHLYWQTLGMLYNRLWTVQPEAEEILRIAAQIARLDERLWKYEEEELNSCSSTA
jgi:hypothetical protein